METQVEQLQKTVEKLQDQLIHQEKMASLGLLSAGIAHEVQNPLNFVINFSKMSAKLLDDLNDVLNEVSEHLNEDQQDDLEDITTSLSENLAKIQQHSQRAVSIIQGILLQSRGKKGEQLPTDISALVHEYVWLSYHAMRANNKKFNASISEDYPANMPKMMVVPQDLSRVILNIINNACYAVDKRAEQEGADFKPSIKSVVEFVNNEIFIRLSDNGGGIPAAVREKLFQEIITTKPVGQGTGLGLSISKQLIKEMNGRLELDTVEGEGTTLTIVIPAVISKY